MSRPEILVVYKKTQLQLALENKNSRIKRLLQRDDKSVRAMRATHEAHQATLVEVERVLRSERVDAARVYRARLRAPMIGKRLIISVGGDGTLLDTSHKVRQQRILGVNSDTVHSVGFLCAAHAENFAALFAQLLAGAWQPTSLRRLAGTIDKTPLPFPVLNDVLVAHKNPAATSRYLIEHGGVVEDHKSSGIWASTAAGSTAALSAAGGDIVPLDDDRLQVRVREPFVADGPQHALSALVLRGNERVFITSKMREARVYLDGPHEMVDLPFGARLALHGGAPPLSLYATDEMKQRRAIARTRT